MKHKSRLLIAVFALLFLACGKRQDCRATTMRTCGEKESELWHWVDVEGMKCRNGSRTGVGIRLHKDAKNLIFFFQRGGACFNEETCGNGITSNQHAFGDKIFYIWARTSGQRGIFKMSEKANPFRDWNAIFVPYCSGDIHSGGGVLNDVPGGPKQQYFSGFENFRTLLKVLTPQFGDMEKILVTGSSAGGYGATANYLQVAGAFPRADISLINDSGPMLEDDAAMSDCLQSLWRDLWGIAKNMPQDCEDCNQEKGDGLVNFYSWLALKFPKGRFGLISYLEDEVIRYFLNFGKNGCEEEDIGHIDAGVFKQALLATRDSILAQHANWGSFFVNGNGHTFMESPTFFTAEINGKSCAEWCGDLVSGRVRHLRQE